MQKFFVFSAIILGTIITSVLIINLVIDFETKAFIFSDIKDLPEAEAVIIPGAAIFSNGDLSAILKDRVDIAILLYKDKKVSKILVSGDNSSVGHNEVNPVRNYLLKNDIPEGDIFLDHAGFDTYSTMYRARDIFGVTSVIIATQAFHLPRAVFIAKELGIEAYGIKADISQPLFYNYIREIFAKEKAVFDLALHLKPKFLGEKIPIMGDN